MDQDCQQGHYENNLAAAQGSNDGLDLGNDNGVRKCTQIWNIFQWQSCITEDLDNLEAVGEEKKIINDFQFLDICDSMNYGFNYRKGEC